jgi:hypothetical protein
MTTWELTADTLPVFVAVPIILPQNSPNHVTHPPAKWVLCSRDHPANYCGCTVYKELQHRKSTNTKNKFLHNTINSNNLNVKPRHPLPSSTNKNVTNSLYTYAQATFNKSPQSPPLPSPDVTKVLTFFIDEFKSLVKPLISLLIQVISSLLSQNKWITVLKRINLSQSYYLMLTV